MGSPIGQLVCQAHVAGWVGLFDPGLAWPLDRWGYDRGAQGPSSIAVVDYIPDWLTPLLDAGQMRAVDRWAIEERGVSALDLMERAGAGVARAVERVAPEGSVAVVCGKGNNGGDGLVVARLLREADRQVTVVCIAPPEDFTGDARVNLARLGGTSGTG